MKRTRSEHIQWCKDRANEYISVGDGQQAMASMLSDLRKHPDTESSVMMAFSLMTITDATDLGEVSRYIDGFN